ncbi:putative paraquat-inducible protein A [Flammeovirgaceae bacterium 311]|nr:putative paraquat-inducible protein A [Flammeovirgaceae bacterium 311]
MPKILKIILVILVAGGLLLIAGWSSFQVYTHSTKRAEIKHDYSEVNSISHGLLSVNIWRDHLTNIAMNRISDFELTSEQVGVLELQVGGLLNAGIDKADSLVNLRQKTIKGKLKKFVVKAVVNEEDIRKMVPVFSETIVKEMLKPENKESLKEMVRSKIGEYSDMTHANSAEALLVDSLYNKYQAADLTDFNQITARQLHGLQATTYFYTYIILAVILAFLLLWVILRNQKAVQIPLFTISVLLALVILAAGVTAPMIEIDARFQEVNFLLVGEKIAFNDQVIFFQSKSIIDVVHILLDTRKVDSVLVGILILVFSVVFPVAKLLSTQIYLAGGERTRNYSLLRFFAFKSSKWSMADVYVIAVFMAYVGFQGILDNQLSNLNVDSESLLSISTNNTSLQPGYILFIAFVLFSLLLSLILKKITTATVNKAVPAEKELPFAIPA